MGLISEQTPQVLTLAERGKGAHPLRARAHPPPHVSRPQAPRPHALFTFLLQLLLRHIVRQRGERAGHRVARPSVRKYSGHTRRFWRATEEKQLTSNRPRLTKVSRPPACHPALLRVRPVLQSPKPLTAQPDCTSLPAARSLKSTTHPYRPSQRRPFSSQRNGDKLTSALRSHRREVRSPRSAVCPIGADVL